MNSYEQNKARQTLRFVREDIARTAKLADNLTYSLGVGTTTADVAYKRTDELKNAIKQLNVGLQNLSYVVKDIIEDL